MMRNTYYFFLLSIFLLTSSHTAFTQIKIIDPTKESPSQEIVRWSPDFLYYYQVKNESDSSIQDLRIRISPFISAKSGRRASIQVKIDNKDAVGKSTKEGTEYGPFSLEASSSLGLELSASLQEPGKHFSQMNFLSNDSLTEEILQVNIKTDSSLAFSISKIATSRNTVFPYSGEPDFWISLVNESSFAQSLRLPSIKNMVQVIAEDEDVDPKYRSYVFYDEEGNILSDKNMIKLEAGVGKRLKMIFKGLSDPGKYSGQLRVSSNLGSTVREAPFTILIKHSWLMAALMILIGVFASKYIKNYVSSIRPQLEVNREIALVGEKLTELTKKYPEPDARMEKVLNSLNQQLDDSKEFGEKGQASELKNSLDTLRKKMALLPEWKEALDRADDQHIKQRVSADARQRLSSVEKTLLKNNPSKVDFEEAEGNLGSLEKSLNDLLNQMPYQDRMEAVGQKLEAAMQADNLDKAKIKALQGARMEKAKASIDNMELEQADKELTAIERELQMLIMEPAFDAVKKELDDKMAIFSDGTKHKSFREESVAAIKVQKKSLSLAKDRMNAGQFEDAQILIQQVSAKLKEIKPSTVKKTDSSNTRGFDLDSMETPFVLENSKATQAIETGLKELILKPGDYNLASIERRIWVNDWVVTGIISAIALIFGLSLLWANDQTWGSSMDYLSALLWGLGLHQVGSGSGLGAIQNQLIGQTPPKKVDQGGEKTEENSQ